MKKLSFYDWLIKNGVSKEDAFDLNNIYIFGGSLTSYQVQLIEWYESYRKN